MSRLSDTPRSDAKDDEDATDTPPTEPLDAPGIDEEHNHHDADPPEQLSEAESNPLVGEPSAETVETPDEPTDLEPPTSYEDDAVLDAFEAAWHQTLHDDTDPDPSEGEAHLRDFADHYDAPVDAPDNDVPRSGDSESADDNPRLPEDSDTPARQEVDGTPPTRPEAGESADDGSPQSLTETRESLDTHDDIPAEQAFETAWTDIHTKEPTDDETRAERAHLTDFARRYAPEDAPEPPTTATDARTEDSIAASPPEDHPADTSQPSDRVERAKLEELVGIETCDRTDKFKVPKEWLDANPGGDHLLAEYDHGTLYRAYQPDSTIHQSGDQHVTGLFFFRDEAAMNHYIAEHNLPTEKYHAYTAHELANGKYAITDFKLRYNDAEQTAYVTLPLENGAVKDTTLRIGDTVNFTLHDHATDATHEIALHRILAKEHNYCAVRLTPTATEYYCSQYKLDQEALLATKHIDMTIESVPMSPEIESVRYAHVNIAKPNLMEGLIRESNLLERLLTGLGYHEVLHADIHLGPDGRRRPDIEVLAEKDKEVHMIIGECKACNERYSNNVAVEAAVQLLSYKLRPDYVDAEKGLLIMTGNPSKPDWDRLIETAASSTLSDSQSKLRLYSEDVINAPSAQKEILKDWYENHVEIIDSSRLREMIADSKTPEQVPTRNAILNFIEK